MHLVSVLHAFCKRIAFALYAYCKHCVSIMHASCKHVGSPGEPATMLPALVVCRSCQGRTGRHQDLPTATRHLANGKAHANMDVYRTHSRPWDAATVEKRQWPRFTMQQPVTRVHNIANINISRGSTFRYLALARSVATLSIKNL